VLRFWLWVGSVTLGYVVGWVVYLRGGVGLAQVPGIHEPSGMVVCGSTPP
jgi:hypothetical protein